MSMGKGMRMYLMAGGDQQRRSEQGGRDSGDRTYDLSNGRFDVHVGDGSGNRGGEMRRIGDPRSEYGGRETHEGQQTEARYRGKDGRYHAGTRRSEYGGGEMRRMGGDDDEETYKVTVRPEDIYQPMIWPTAPESRQEDERYANYGSDGTTDRQIGFGAMMHMDGQQSRQHMEMGRTGSMQGMRFDEQTAREWVDSMQGVDKSHPKGGKWTPEQLEALAKKHGVPTTGREWWEFYAMVNAMYADYSDVAKAYNITSPDYYARMALAFIRDKDALPDKVARYWEYIAAK